MSATQSGRMISSLRSGEGDADAVDSLCIIHSNTVAALLWRC